MCLVTRPALRAAGLESDPPTRAWGGGQRASPGTGTCRELPSHSEETRVPGPRICAWLPRDRPCQPPWSCPTPSSPGELITDLLHQGCSNVSLHRAPFCGPHGLPPPTASPLPLLPPSCAQGPSIASVRAPNGAPPARAGRRCLSTAPSRESGPGQLSPRPDAAWPHPRLPPWWWPCDLAGSFQATTGQSNKGSPAGWSQLTATYAEKTAPPSGESLPLRRTFSQG